MRVTCGGRRGHWQREAPQLTCIPGLTLKQGLIGAAYLLPIKG